MPDAARNLPRPVEDRIKVRWLVRLRWAALVGQTVTIAVVSLGRIVHLPVRPLLLLVAIGTLGNVCLELWSRSSRRVPAAGIGLVMIADALLLTATLAFSGSYSNPFSTLYLVNVALATVLLPPRWAWAVLGVSLAGFGSLFALDLLKPGGLRLSELDHQELMKLHLQGMWVALAIAAVFIVYVVNRVTRALQRRELELVAERSLSARKDKVASLATLAAGAAHELSTPLTTIAVVTRELERMLAASPPEVRSDLSLIRQQIERCQEILGQMAVHAGENAGEPLVPLSPADWVARALEGLLDRERVQASIDPQAAVLRLEGPAAAIVRALRSLVNNALQASPPGEPIQVRLRESGGFIRAAVSDRGPGIPPATLARMGEPFFTTKQPGHGMGLGLFLTRTLAEQLGGALEMESAPGVGTTATLRLPASIRPASGSPLQGSRTAPAPWPAASAKATP